MIIKGTADLAINKLRKEYYCSWRNIVVRGMFINPFINGYFVKILAAARNIFNIGRCQVSIHKVSLVSYNRCFINENMQK
jgi:hypothetical protein